MYRITEHTILVHVALRTLPKIPSRAAGREAMPIPWGEVRHLLVALARISVIEDAEAVGFGAAVGLEDGRGVRAEGVARRVEGDAPGALAVGADVWGLGVEGLGVGEEGGADTVCVEVRLRANGGCRAEQREAGGKDGEERSAHGVLFLVGGLVGWLVWFLLAALSPPCPLLIPQPSDV
uniref:Uncharacterized protein n=1 Tax=Mycena chlorophos TaxID=658473 RepID=A0ABQ0L3V0_MYCCL|nr:predicted protein [Mycena chlorophos]